MASMSATPIRFASSSAIRPASEGAIGNLRDKRALVVGAGRIGLQTLKAFSGRDIAERAVANRSEARAAEAAGQFGAQTYPLESLGTALAWADVAITATSSEQPVVRAELVRQAMREREGRPLVLVDLAVPADVERSAAVTAAHEAFAEPVSV